MTRSPAHVHVHVHDPPHAHVHDLPHAQARARAAQARASSQTAVAVLVWLAGMAAAACHAPSDPGVGSGDGIAVSASRSAITGGTADNVEFPSVCALRVVLPPGDEELALDCTCTLIEAQTVLTAANCVYKNVEADMLDGITVLFGNSVGSPVETRSVTAVELHRYFDARADRSARDLDAALLRLDAPSASPPVALHDEPFDRDLAGTPVTLVGFGETADDQGGGTRLVVSEGVVINTVNGGFITAGTQDATSCDGDSGGPVFADLGAGPVQIAVTSFQDRCQANVRRNRVDVMVHDFLFPYIDRVSGPCPLDGTCTTAGCRTPDPDCDECAWQGDPMRCAEDCDTRDWDCDLGAFPGEACAASGECERGGGCVAARDDPAFTYCSLPCDPADDRCPGELACTATDSGGICEFGVPSPGSQGYACGAGSDCRSGICEEQICVFECDPGDPAACAEPYTCGPSTVQAGTHVCLGEPVSGGGGFCAVSPAPASSLRMSQKTSPGGWLAVGLALLLATRRRRRAHG